MRTPDDLLRFPNGTTVSEIKKQAKKLKKETGKSHSQVLRQLTKDCGIDLPWEKALNQLRTYWDSHFAEFIFQEESEWDFTVLIGGFKNEQSALKYAKRDGSLKWFNGMLLFKYDGDDHPEWRILDEREIVIKQQKPETIGNMTVYPQDFELVKFRSHEFSQVVGRKVTSFGSLAYGVSKSPLIQELPTVEKNQPDFIKGEVLGLKFRASQFGHKIYQIKGVIDDDKHHYIHTNFNKNLLWLALALEKAINFDNYKKLRVASLPMKHYSLTHLELYDFSNQREFDKEFEGMECHVIDFSNFELPKIETLSSPFISLFWAMTQSVIKLQSSLNKFSDHNVVDYEYAMKLIKLGEIQSISDSILDDAKKTYQYPKDYYDKVTASVLPLIHYAPISQPHLS